MWACLEGGKRRGEEHGRVHACVCDACRLRSVSLVQQDGCPACLGAAPASTPAAASLHARGCLT
eukprot:scaffold289167_cov15-Tisochrysis_lutea.AAC.1